MKLALRPILHAAGVPDNQVTATINAILGPVTDIADVRLVPVVGVGPGSIRAQARPISRLSMICRTSLAVRTTPALGAGKLGSFTILPMVLLLNPGRAERRSPRAGFPAIPLVRHRHRNAGNPCSVRRRSRDHIDGDTGLAIGGANLIPIKLDIGIQNFPASDFAAWPNPVTLANNGAALLFPTYIIRGFDEDAIEDSLEDQLEASFPGALASRPLALNFYLTVPISGAPVLEPTYLAVDALNLVTGGSFNNPIGTALNPFLESAGNLGYTDVERHRSTAAYVRTFDDTGTPTAFFSFPDVEWEKVPGDLFNQLRVWHQAGVRRGARGQYQSRTQSRKLLKLLGLDNSSSSSSSSLGLSSFGGLTDGLVGNALGSTLGSQSESLRTTSFAPDPVSSTTTGGGPTVQLTQGSGSPTPPPATGAADVTNAPRKRPVAEILERLGNTAGAPRTTAVTGTSASSSTALRDAAKQASDGVKKTVESVNDGLKKAVTDVQNAVKDTAKKMSDAAKPKASAADGE